MAFAFRAIAQEEPEQRRFIAKYSPQHHLEFTFKPGIEFKSKSLRQSFSVYCMLTRLRERQPFHLRKLSGLGLELQYRYYFASDQATVKNKIQTRGFGLLFARTAHHEQTFDSWNGLFSQRSTYFTKDLGLGYGLQWRWRRVSADLLAAVARRFNDVTNEGDIGFHNIDYYYREKDRRREPALELEGFFLRAGLELGFRI